MKLEEHPIEDSNDIELVLIFESDEDMKMYNALVKLGKTFDKTPEELVNQIIKEKLE